MKKVCHNILLCKKVTQSYWQLTRVALEWNAQARAEFGAHIGDYGADQLVFVDESSVDHWITYHGYAWSLKGHWATWKTFFCHGRR